jgi:cytidine deaminase
LHPFSELSKYYLIKHLNRELNLEGEIKLSSEERSKLLSIAKKAAKKAYAPYSNFNVGAALLTVQGHYYSGCNVENASYGLTICAERNAIFSAVTCEGANNMKIRAIAVATDKDFPCPPCGACRQVILEFAKDAVVIFQGREGLKEFKISKLLPEGFIFK